jgi:hypothetical protein
MSNTLQARLPGLRTKSASKKAKKKSRSVD